MVFKSKRVAFPDGVMPASIVIKDGKIQAIKGYNVDRVELCIDEYMIIIKYFFTYFYVLFHNMIFFYFL